MIRRAGWLLLFITAAIYLPAVGAGFVWDDPQQIVGNLLTDDLRNLPAIFSTDVWSTAGVVVENPPYYRPLLITSFALDRALWGLSTAGAHLQSLAWHLAAVACVIALLRRLLPPVPALVGAALFALHPLQSEAVIWVSARNDPMCATFCVGAVLALLPERPGPGRLLAGGALMLAGLLTKELALMTGAFLVGLDIARFGRPRGWARYAAVGVALAAWAWLRARAGVGGSDALSIERLSTVAGEFVTVVGLYGKLFVWPWPLTVARRLGDLHEPAWAVAAGWAVFLVGGAIWIRRGRGLALAGLAFAAVTFGPTLLGMGATH